MTELISMPSCEGPLDASVSLPGSKSITNRCLLMAALAEGVSQLDHALISDDTLIFAECLRRMGVPVHADVAQRRFLVEGQGGRVRDRGTELFIGNAGTAARFITPMLLLGRGEYLLDGVAAMRKRPMRDLLTLLAERGASFQWRGEPYHFPLAMRGAGGFAGGEVDLAAEKTSQQATGLLLIAPYAASAVTLRLQGRIVSPSYLEMTCRLMREWGAQVERTDESTFMVRSGSGYVARTATIEPDASSASYFFAAAAAVGGKVQVRHLSDASVQGDLKFVDVLTAMGCTATRGPDFVEVSRTSRLRGVEVDMNDISDTAPTLAALAPLADTRVVIRNVEHMRWKETDRITAMATELRRLGAAVEELRDGLAITPGRLHPATVETYDDHRIAMSLAILGLRTPGLVIRNPGCVAKTFPTFFDELLAMIAATQT